MGKRKISITSPVDTERVKAVRILMDDINKISYSIKGNFTSMAREVAGFATNQLMEPLEGIKGVVQQLGDIDLTSMTRYSSILSTIVSTTKSLAGESLS